MRTPRCLPGVRNGAVAKRQSRSKNPARSSKALGAFSLGAGIPRPRPNSRRVSNRAGEGRGSKVMWMLILIGVALAAGFVFALRSQINAYRIAQAEEQLKTQLDGYASQQNFLTLDQQRALSAGESDRAGRRNGLDHLKLDRDARSERSASGQWVISHVPPVRARQADQSGRPAVNASRWAPRSIKRPGSQAKVVKVVKVVKTGKSAKVVKVVKLNAAKREGATNKSRVNVVKPRKQSQRQTSSARQ
jgi:hypothetical protein